MLEAMPSRGALPKNPYLLILWLGVALALVVEASLQRPGFLLNPNEFGWEYGNVASALVNGRGYSDPFGFPTGPTAWMPPGVVMIFAAVFSVFGDKSLLSWHVMSMLKVAGVTAALACLVRSAELQGWRSRARGLIFLGAAALLGRFSWLTRVVMDEWVVILASSLIVLCLAELGGRGRPRAWHGLLALCLPLTIPVLAFAFALVLLGRALRGQRRVWLLLLCFGLATAAWMGRNRLVMGQAYLVKSNFWFEFYQATAWTSDGLLDRETLIWHHPSRPGGQSAMDYAALGERKFCNRFRAPSLELIRRHPGSVAAKVGNRAYSALVANQPFNDLLPSALPVSKQDAELLGQARLLAVGWQDEAQYWLVTRWADGQARAAFERLSLSDPEAVFASWKAARRARQAVESDWSNRLWTWLYALLPSLALLAGLLGGGWRVVAFREAAILYVGYFLPYVLITHVERYQVGALALQVWLVWMAFSGVLSRSPAQSGQEAWPESALAQTGVASAPPLGPAEP
jgi:hypothetical protein